VIVRADGTSEDHSVVSGLTVNRGEIIRIILGTGAGWGDPTQRDLDLVRADLKNGYTTREQTNKYYRGQQHQKELTGTKP